METLPTQARDYQTKRKRLEKRLGSLENERGTYDPTYRDLSDYLAPGHARFLTNDRNQGQRRDRKIYDDTGGEAVRVLQAGLMSYGTSPARDWFQLAIADKDLSQSHVVKMWLQDAAQAIRDAFNRSNVYQVLPHIYRSEAVFGTACAILSEDEEEDIHLYPVTVGQFVLAQDHRWKVNTMFRKFEMTVEQVVERWGIENVSDRVHKMYSMEHNYDAPVTVVHAIEPRKVRDEDSDTADNMPFLSCYFEMGCDGDKVLGISGFEDFPVLAPRWDLDGGDVYGFGPGRMALGAIKGLQHMQYSMAVAVDKGLDPPQVFPTALKGQEVDTNPGGRIYFDAVTPHSGVRSLYESPFQLEPMQMAIDDRRRQIRRFFHADLFQMLDALSDTTERTKYELQVRREETLQLLGPVYTRQTEELHRPLVEQTFRILQRRGKIPPHPPEMDGQFVGVEFVSILAQAAKSVGMTSMQTYAIALGQIAALGNGKEQILDRLDEDAYADEIAAMSGVDLRVVRSLDSANELRQARNAAMQAKEQQAAMAEQAKITRDLGASPTGEQNVLTDVMAGLQGYGYPQPV